MDLCTDVIRNTGTSKISPLYTVRDMAVEHIAGLAFGGQQPHSPEEHVENPNVLILRSMKVKHTLTHRSILSC